MPEVLLDVLLLLFLVGFLLLALQLLSDGWRQIIDCPSLWSLILRRVDAPESR